MLNHPTSGPSASQTNERDTIAKLNKANEDLMKAIKVVEQLIRTLPEPVTPGMEAQVIYLTQLVYCHSLPSHQAVASGFRFRHREYTNYKMSTYMWLFRILR